MVDCIDVKKRFLKFFYVGHVFYVFDVFYFPNVFYLKKTFAKFTAASRLTRSTFRITATKYTYGFINNRIQYPVVRM